MTAEQTRDQLVDALRRDLLGPLADPDGHYPAATPITLHPGAPIATVRDLSHLYVAPDGYEVLIGESPVGRFVTGALYPTLSAHDDIEVDDAQAPSAGDIPDAEPAPAVADIAAPVLDDDTLEAATDADLDATAVTVDRVGRPSSMGVSLVIDDDVTSLDVHVTGARYETYDLTVAGKAQQGWHRVPVNETRAVTVPAEPGRVTGDINDGPLRVQVGVDVRATKNGTRVVTAYIVNRTPRGTGHLAPLVLFTAALKVTVPTGHLHDYPEPDVDTSPEARTLRLLYTTAPVRAVGHGCDATVEDALAGHVVSTEAFPVARVAPTTPDISDETGSLAVDMDDLGQWKDSARAVVARTITAYRAWIAARRADAAALTGQAATTAAEHLDACEAFADDIQAGWALAQTGPVHTALRYASLAMATQRRSYAAMTRPVTFNKSTKTFIAAPAPTTTGRPPAWRPFQLAFILANLPAQIDPTHSRRGAVDVIWMPTGGGKTEAYLGLAAFTMLHRRLLDPTAKGTTVLMRYTLRLLTAQQLQRAASLICALNDVRDDGRTGELGTARFSIGAWLGKASTPNTRKEAQTMLTALGNRRGTRRRPFLLSRCPSCATAMGDVHDGKVAGYDLAPVPGDSTKNRMRAVCPNPDCAYSKGAGLPVFEVDEDVYAARPTFVVATVDKFAQLAWNDKPRSLFGIAQDGTRQVPPPELIIQDELHLISGPLGSLVGLYESTIDHLCRHDGGTPPRIVAATATTRAYGRQAQHLYACSADDVRLVPPPGLSADDSFFATVNPDVPPRLHIGVCATGVSRFQHTEMRVLSSLTHAAAAVEQADTAADLNPYWTNVVFFGSLRDLGQAKSLLATDARSYAWRLHRSTGVSSGSKRADDTRAAVRYQHDVELTSAASADAAMNLDKLTKPKGDPGCVDLALATSVIEVGVDVDRLGLLTMIRQPKTASQYIQVSGRVGRDATKGPGVVVTVLNPANSRDMSHYERFTSTHARLYAAVEPASVTPFTGAALTRGLRGALASTVRQVRPANSPAVTAADLDLIDAAADAMRARLVTLPHTSVDVFDEVAAYARAQAAQANMWQLAWGTPHSPAFLRPPETPAPVDMPSWSVLMSLRSVDGDAAVHLDDQALPARASQPAAPITGEEDDAW